MPSKIHDHKFGKNCRLSSTEIKNFFTQNCLHKLHTQHLTFLYCESEETKVAPLIKKAHVKSAVVRNWLKRITRENFRLSLVKDASKHHRVVVISKPKIRYATTEDIYKCLKKFLDFIPAA
ncbi:MAG: hypothetical protein COB50_05545 [Thiotrichales bacterium]|nr:MAG: hypothetical protein COB50_05545 [Thiotrichales bacterium]